MPKSFDDLRKLCDAFLVPCDENEVDFLDVDVAAAALREIQDFVKGKTAQATEERAPVLTAEEYSFARKVVSEYSGRLCTLFDAELERQLFKQAEQLHTDMMLILDEHRRRRSTQRWK